MGEHKLDMPMLGRWMKFAPGFADLALSTRATVLPVSTPVDEMGRYRMEIHAPLDPGDKSEPRPQRIESLVHQYTQHLEQLWISNPGNVEPIQAKKMAILPRTNAPPPTDQDTSNQRDAEHDVCVQATNAQ